VGTEATNPALEPARPSSGVDQPFIISGEGGRIPERASKRASNLKVIAQFRKGAFLLKRVLPRVLTGIVIACSMSAGTLWSRTQAPNPQPADQENRSSETSSGCFGAIIGKIDFHDVNSSDQRTLRNLIPLHEGDLLERQNLQLALRALYATGRFANLRAECDRTPDDQATLSFVSSANFFVGRVAVEGAPPHPTESQIVNASKLQLGELFTSEKMDRGLENIHRLMEENGYYRASVSHSEQQNPETQQVEISLQIHPGPAAHVGKVALQGKSTFSLGQLEDIAHLHPGDLVTAQTGTNAIDRIRKRYQKKNRWLAQVAIADRQYRPQTNTVDYTLEVDSGPLVQIFVEGFRLSKSTIRRSIPVYEENALDDDLLNEGRRNLLTYMESRGYFDASVDLKKESDPQQNLVRVIYQIDPGERHKVVKVEITGNKYFRDEQLRTGMQVQPKNLLLPHGRYSAALLRSDVRDIENKYRANGFAQIKVESHAEDDYHAKNRIAVFIHINEDPQTVVGSLQITGNVTENEASFPPLNTQPGQPFSDVNVAQDRDILLNYYFNNGFPNATFEATARPDGENRMDVVFHIHEGDRTYVDQVLVSGREFTKPYIVNRELQIKPEDPLSQSSILDTQQRLYNLGIFSQVDTAVQNPEGVEPNKNVLVQLREAKRYTFNYGGGFEFQTGQPVNGTNQPLGSTGVSPLVSFDVSRLNFLGRDHTITFVSRIGGLQQRGLISYEAPQLFSSRDWKLTFTAFFDHTVEVTTFTSQRLEGVTQAEQIISRKADGSSSAVMDYRFNYRLVKAILTENFSLEQVPLLSLPVRLGEPGFSYIRNHRDNDLETTRGSYNTVDAGVASSYFGSQADFSHILLQNATYHPFGKKRGSTKEIVFARSTRVGLENPFANTVLSGPGFTPPSNLTQIPLPERFFMGGGNSHRGFGLNQAGPRDPQSGFPLGGAALFLNNFELRFPPPTLPFVQDNMSFAVFHDMGNVFTTGNDMLHSLLRWHQGAQSCSQALNTPLQLGDTAKKVPPAGAALCNYNYISHAIGIGVRYKTPVGPVRFDFGYNLNPTVFPTFQSVVVGTTSVSMFVGTKQASPFNVYFSIGQAF
jgi:outer membrane protein insertion porin family